jgi:hypothetical protein
MAVTSVNPETFRNVLKQLIRRIRKCNTITISLEDVRALAKSIAHLWFNDILPFTKLVSINEDVLRSIDDKMTTLISYTLRATKKTAYLLTLNEALKIYEKNIYIELHKDRGAILSGPPQNIYNNSNIINGLANISESLSAGYQQVYQDLSDGTRISWRGTANELREVLRELLEILAPDAAVKKAKWFAQDPKTEGPTQEQRAKYILEQRALNKTQAPVIQETLTTVEESIARLVRKTYKRINNASHTQQDQEEIKNILNYFNLLIKELLGIS